MKRHVTYSWYAALGSFVLGVAGVFSSPNARAQAPKPVRLDDAASAISEGRSPASATIDRILDQAVINIAVRYNLNDKQRELTQKMMHREVYRFLREHENEVWPTLRGLFSSGGQAPGDKDLMKQLGRSGLPLAKLAREAIFKSNDEWRLILNEEQKRVHDYDMREMRATFEKLDENLRSWAEGKPTTGPLFPQPDLTNPQPPRPSRPPAVVAETHSLFDPNPILETIVEEFIRDYGLDEGQITAAQSILEEFKGKARDYKDSKKREFGKVAADKQRAIDEGDLDGVKKTHAEYKKLVAPILGLCKQMEGRLEGLLTTAQRQRHDERSRTAARSKRPAPAKKPVDAGPADEKQASKSTGDDS